MKKLLVIFIVILILSSCVFKRTSTIGILNKSDHTIYVYDLFLDSLALYITNSLGNTCRTGFDTSSVFNSGIWVYSSNRVVPDSMTYIHVPPRKEIFRSSLCIDGKLRIFIFKEETIRKYSWEVICKHQMYEKKLTLTEAELKKNDWTVVYE